MCSAALNQINVLLGHRPMRQKLLRASILHSRDMLAKVRALPGDDEAARSAAWQEATDSMLRRDRRLRLAGIDIGAAGGLTLMEMATVLSGALDETEVV